MIHCMKKLIIYFIVSLAGFFIVSSIPRIFYTSYFFGLPFPMYRFPFDCAMQIDPNYLCEGFIWKGVLYDILIWLTASVLIVNFYKVIINSLDTIFINVKKVFAKTYLISLIILAAIILILIFLTYTRKYISQDVSCGGFIGKTCPVGYYCPESKYPDQLKKCVSLFEFLRQR